jgi:hypothetical protein
MAPSMATINAAQVGEVPVNAPMATPRKSHVAQPVTYEREAPLQQIHPDRRCDRADDGGGDKASDEEAELEQFKQRGPPPSHGPRTEAEARFVPVSVLV